MIQDNIKELLEKYWNCETSVEEEQYLKAFFLENKVSGEEEKYKALFDWKKEKLQVKGSKKWETLFVKRPAIHFYSLLKIAASVLLVLTIGIGIHTHYEQEKYMDKVFSETSSDPDSLRETKNVIEKVSEVLSLTKDKQIEKTKLDSLKKDTISIPSNSEIYDSK
jgi:hypothetical protein